VGGGWEGAKTVSMVYTETYMQQKGKGAEVWAVGCAFQVAKTVQPIRQPPNSSTRQLLQQQLGQHRQASSRGSYVLRVCICAGVWCGSL
jgi:hypothetical protein